MMLTQQSSLGRQHLHEQDVGRGLGHCRAGDSYHGGGVSEQHPL